jgi:hypothetical protein
MPFKIILRYTSKFRMRPARQASVRDGDNPTAKELTEKIENNI